MHRVELASELVPPLPGPGCFRSAGPFTGEHDCSRSGGLVVTVLSIILAHEVAALLDQNALADQPFDLSEDRLLAGGDPRQLRGIPAIGPSVTGAIAGSAPVAVLLEKERQRERRPTDRTGTSPAR